MIDLATVNPDILKQTQKAFREQIMQRGWKAMIPDETSVHCFITRDDGKQIHIFSSTPPTTSYAAGKLANDKFSTYQLLESADIPQLDTIKVTSSTDPAIGVEFMHRHGKIVVKPIDSGHGNGITVNVTTEEELEKAIEIALEESKEIHAAVLQQHYESDKIYDLRMLYINYEFVGGIQRIAARVFGDGEHTIRQLIEIENATDRRGRAYKEPLATIQIDKVEAYLKEKMDVVPENGEEVQVMGVANYGAGGETVDVTDLLPDWLVDEAERIARATGLGVAGVDYMLALLPEKGHSREQLKPAFTEVNKCPLLTMHNTPTVGENRHAVEKYMDYLASL